MFSVQDFNLRLWRDMDYFRRLEESDRLVKARFKLADGPIHQNHRLRFIHAQDAAKPVLKMENIPGMKPERIGQRLPEDADKLSLVRVFEITLGGFHRLFGVGKF